jgi:hypothetical protein
MPILAWLASTHLGRGVAAAGAVLLAVAAVYFKGRSAGGTAARTKAKDADHDRAEEIRDRVDVARADDGDPVERLRDAGRLRD